tara:strand:- start:15501 stop:16127 length:627 start_codon:yes stop_codon:yes gene_type:complete
MLFNEEIRYPKKGDKFFKHEGDPDEIAWMNKAFQDFGSYGDSYRTGAIKLLDLALSDKSLRDLNIYPAIFLMRHYMELRLKEFIQGINFCNDQSKDFPTGHDLKRLWSEFKQKYPIVGGDCNDDRFKVIDKLIDEISLNDPISMAFRYPVDKKGGKTQKLEYVNLRTLRETFVRLCFVFDGIGMQIFENVSYSEEMIMEMRSYYTPDY